MLLRRPVGALKIGVGLIPGAEAPGWPGVIRFADLVIVN